ncbi:MAG: hypothetical protein HY366_00130 [Candidatus Aenigmarchaeota archaeon]|nr:hypothetical protein [Candidatus Aenigmarchaeota archaeon]
MNKRGQIMIMTAVVLVLAIVAIRIEFDSVAVVESLEFQRSLLSPELLENIRTEIANTARLAFTEDPEGASVDARLNNFTRFVREHDDVRVIYSTAHFLPSSTLRIRVRNQLDEDIGSVTVEHNISGTSATIVLGDIAIGQAAAGTASNAATSEKTVQINVSYTAKSTGTNRRFTYHTLAGPNLNYTAMAALIVLKVDGSSLSDATSLVLSYNTSSGGTSGGGINLPLQPVILPG